MRFTAAILLGVTFLVSLCDGSELPKRDEAFYRSWFRTFDVLSKLNLDADAKGHYEKVMEYLGVNAVTPIEKTNWRGKSKSEGGTLQLEYFLRLKKAHQTSWIMLQTNMIDVVLNIGLRQFADFMRGVGSVSFALVPICVLAYYVKFNTAEACFRDNRDAVFNRLRDRAEIIIDAEVYLPRLGTKWPDCETDFAKEMIRGAAEGTVMDQGPLGLPYRSMGFIWLAHQLVQSGRSRMTIRTTLEAYSKLWKWKSEIKVDDVYKVLKKTDETKSYFFQKTIRQALGYFGPYFRKKNQSCYSFERPI